MKQNPTQQAREKAAQYGMQALNNDELLKIVKYTGENYYSGPEYLAATELIRRKPKTTPETIKSSLDAYNHFKHLENLQNEEFHACFLNVRCHIIKSIQFSKGSEAGVVTLIKDMLKTAIQLKAHSIILCHNHPSGEPSPSEADNNITQKLKNAALFIDTKVIDHVIIGNGKYYSYADQGTI